MSNDKNRLLRRLPGVDAMLERAAAAPLAGRFGRRPLTDALREALDALRARIMAGAGPADAEFEPDAVIEAAARRLAEAEQPRLRRAVNATGILLHTGLGRAPMPPAAREALARVAGPCNVQLALDTGARIRREETIRDVVREVTGAEDCLLVNNNAGATLLALAALCRGREAVVSRGELIEIGGSFRLPDVMEQSGAIMREVGTTNKTHVRDYEAAVGPNTGLLMKVHRSNFSIVGFAKELGIAEIAAVGKRHGVLVADDLGCGALIGLERYGLPHETTMRESLEAGADIVLASTDKLIGGPQGGLIAGRAEVIARVRSHPLYRALRVCKLTLGAVEATMRLFRAPDLLPARHPLYAMIARTADEVARQAGEVAAAVRARRPGWSVQARADEARLGGGSLPDSTLPSSVVAITAPDRPAENLAAAFRAAAVPVVPRVHEDAVLADMRTVLPEEVADVLAAVDGI
ncbi:MAG: L-seryl-tRNA(Sec) selenium transferase [Lentisphaerae bacterium]|nr:L-seryl-tRNA(Sec) selenium transferase [Lentisphaerota bacterium]